MKVIAGEHATEHQQRTILEGFCPDCLTALTPLTPDTTLGDIDGICPTCGRGYGVRWIERDPADPLTVAPSGWWLTTAREAGT